MMDYSDNTFFSLFWIGVTCVYRYILLKLWETESGIKRLFISSKFIQCLNSTIHRTGHGTTDWFQIGKGVHQDCILSPCSFNLYAEYIMWNARLDEAQAGIKISGKNISKLRHADETTIIAESEEELKSLDESERGEWKSWLKVQHSEEDHGIRSQHFMA